MKAFVFTDASLARHAGRFVWLEIDGEKSRNAAARRKLKIPAYPTLYVMDPADERIALRWVGAPSVAQLHKLLDDGLAAVKGTGSDLDARLARADSLYGVSADSAAAVAYLDVLASAPKDWPHYPRVVDAALFALSVSDGEARCTALAFEAMERTWGTTSGANAALSGLGCALSLPADHPGRADLVARFEARCVEAVHDSSIALSVDDRSGIYLTLADAREDAKDDEGRLRFLNENAGLLERGAAAAKTPYERAVFDPHRLSVYLALGQPGRAVPMLEASARDFPEDYNPPARLAVALRHLKRYDDALRASDRALAKAYGPRKLLLFDNRVDIQLAAGDSAAARRTLATAIEEGEAMPEGVRSDGRIRSLRKRLTTVRGATTSP